MTEYQILAVKLIIIEKLQKSILNNKLLFWNKTQFNKAWLDTYIFKG
jgi:hypothetical protein